MNPTSGSPRRRVLLGAGAVVALAAGGVAAVGFGGGEPPPATAANLPPATAKVVVTTLTGTERVTGALGRGPATAVPPGPPGTVTWLPAPGAVIGRGQPVYRVDDRPVPLLFGATPAWRTLSSGVAGEDVRQFEENLEALGYTGFTVDTTFTAGTADAVRAWQRDTGRLETGTVPAAEVVFAPGEVRVAELKVPLGGEAGGPVLTHTGTTRVVTVPLEVAKQHLVAPGVTATVTLPDGRTVPGVVESVGTVASAQPGTDTETTVDVVVAVADQAALGSLDAAPVEVRLVSTRKEDVLAVPVGALVFLGEGRYGVQVVDGGTTRYVPVDTGLFADGKVEVSGGGVTAGLDVGVPR
ncbi:peptidoglycan-binding domain-containing protein [Actinosynnema sp. NPDC047251]|uniref:Peptidoglycan-binding domain 1 protein n=1 Tax=Saccharothrix espanaensis (strain ATCC 51144 / DSM 44229 / JCM 9112 / NBRC 15066 / NRRL 15764) TaxID=1179773 RepID=K0JY42_SACES|nr:peptidoglycan-binding domain-containing protein [Saccharothrix espanaensis]CCH29088.1 Peptidoglycan-binding domain 1 protein [Saccharothrix espanaensis DSM 44229]